jgi:glycosyltransferase involved in cell wall biosynthesis
MKILHFYKNYLPDSIGGVEQVIRQICESTAKHGVSSEVLTLSDSIKSFQFGSHQVHCAKTNFEIASTRFSISAIKYFYQLSKNADIIHYHFPWPYMDFVHFATRVHKPTVVTYHSDIIRQKVLLHLYRPLERRFLKSVNCIVTTSPNYLATSSVLNQFSKKVRVIPIGIDKSLYPVPTKERLDYWQNLFSGRFFLFVGVIRYYKGLNILLDAASGTDYPVVIVGAGPIEKELKRKAHILGLKNIFFLGRLSEEDKIALLMLCYAVVFPSHLRSEAFGVSLLEGAMFGKPMISTEIGTGTSYVNLDGETGLVVPPSNTVAFRNAMRYLLENPDVAGEMGRKAEARYWKLFTADRMALDYIDLYTELIS